MNVRCNFIGGAGRPAFAHRGEVRNVLFLGFTFRRVRSLSAPRLLTLLSVPTFS